MADRPGTALARIVAALNPWGAAARARTEAETAERRLREALDALPTGVVFLDEAQRYILWNKAYAEIYHRSSDLFQVGRPLADTLRIGVARGDYPAAVGREEAWLAERLALLANPTGERQEQLIRDGRWVMIEERRTADGGIIGLRVDITDLKAQAAALQAALAHAEAAGRAKAEFLADMSHELRTPLNGVIGLAEVLARAPLAPEHASIVTELLASAGRLNGLVNDLLDTLEAGQADAEIAAKTGAARGAKALPLGGAAARLPDRTLKVLVADDNPTNRRVAELMLAAIGAEVASVENGAEAVAAVGAEGFDLILMDLKMPVMDGLSAIAAIREAELAEGRARRPIVVLSANTAAEDVEASLAAGADGHLGKPIRPDALLSALEQVMRRPER